MSREDFEVFHEMRAEKKAMKAQRRASWEALFMQDELPGKWVKCHDTHWQTELKGDTLDYWPGTQLFRWRGKSRHGDVLAFIRRETEA